MTWLDELNLSTVIVHTKNNGPSYRGIIDARYDDGLLLSSVVNLDEDVQVVEAGTSFLPRQEIHRIQLIEGG